MMTSPVTGDFASGPLYFFDQPTRQDRTKCSRILTHLHFNLANEGAPLPTTIKSELPAGSECAYNDHKEVKSDESKLAVQSEICGQSNDAQVDGLDEINSMDAYKHMAPQLLSELGELLLQYEWSGHGCIPHGLVNFLNYSWKDLTAGAVYKKPSWPLGISEGAKPRKSSTNLDQAGQMGVNGKKKINKKTFVPEKNATERNTQEQSNVRKKTSVTNANNAVHLPTTISFSISSKTCKEQGWLVQPKEPDPEEPHWTALCHWVVERLTLARVPIKAQAAQQAEQGRNQPPVLRHYGEATPRGDATPHGRKAAGAAWPVARFSLCNGMPQIPEVKPVDPSQHKLHYRINDGSAFIYYPSGHMAVCQSHSALPCGGFYTNVFSDDACPVILASITAFGHGSATHPASGAITAVWDPRGGLTYDPDGTVTKEWSWQTGPGLKEKILVQVSDQICVRLFSGASAILCFKSPNESVQLPLSSLSVAPPEETALQSRQQLSSLVGQQLSQARRTRKDHRRAMGLKSVSTRSCQILQMVREVERLEEPSPFRRGGRAGGELRRLQRRVKTILDHWLEFYCMATGIKCPDLERMSDAPECPRLKREVQSAALPTLNPAVSTTEQPEGGSAELQALPRHLSAPGDLLLASSAKLARTFSPKKQEREELHHVTHPGTLRGHSNIRLDSAAVPESPEAPRPAAQSHRPSHPSSLCPAQLRAALRGEKGRRLCRCSSRLIPGLTDLEYDAFVSGQPARSEQILVVRVTRARRPPLAASTPGDEEDALEELHERMNKNRTAPCTQCQLDSFRLVRYEMSTGTPAGSAPGSAPLLQHRHNAAPGMFLMYLRGKLLFADYIFNGYSCSVRDLHKQIAKTRGDHRLGRSLPPDYRFSVRLKSPVAKDQPDSQKPRMTSVGGEAGDGRGTPEINKAQTSERITTQGPVTSFTLKTEAAPRTKKTPAASLPILTH